MLDTDLLGKPIYLEAGLFGNHNDRGLRVEGNFYLTHGTFHYRRGKCHHGQGVCTQCSIKQWSPSSTGRFQLTLTLVGKVAYKGGIDTQGINFMLCTQLTATAMRIHDTYPRGNKFLANNDERKQWR
eukprot:6174392-Pleurochrysis_carterae.AAC.1